MSCLHLRELSVRFPTAAGPLQAVHEVSLDHEAGETLALLGESGCGKSVIALAVLGLLPEAAEVRGRVEFEGRDLLRLGDRELAELRGERIAIVMQNPSLALNPIQRIERQIAEPLRIHRGLRLRAARPVVRSWLERLGFRDVEEHLRGYPFQFSGGMNQRVMIAASIVASPRLLIADEPTKGLDRALRRVVAEELEAVRRVEGASLLLITHDVPLARRLADRVAVMYGGQIMELAPSAELFGRPLHPYTQGLLRSLPENGFRPMPGPALDMTGLPAGCRFHPRCPLADDECRSVPPALRARGPRAVRCLRCC